MFKSSILYLYIKRLLVKNVLLDFFILINFNRENGIYLFKKGGYVYR